MYKSTAQQPAGKWTDVHYPPQALAHCPTTSAYVRGNEQTSFLIPGGEVNWWHCSACQGWHVLIAEAGEKVKPYI